MLHDLALVVIGMLVGLFSTMLLGALTVRSDLKLLAALMPNLVTKEHLNEALKKERHDMWNDWSEKFGTLETDVRAAVIGVETRLRRLEISVARLTPNAKDETL